MDDLIKREEAVRSAGEDLLGAFEAIQQPRSDFQLAHFVVCQHDTPARQWAQAVLELQIKVFNIARIQLDIEEKSLQRTDLIVRAMVAEKDQDRRLLEIQAERLRIDVEEIRLARLGNVREAETLLSIVRSLEAQHQGPYTREELQAGEAEYWDLRLTRQAYASARRTIDAGNLEALLETMTELGETRARLIAKPELLALVGVDEVVPQLPGGNGAHG
jgi:hypothetical protein